MVNRQCPEKAVSRPRYAARFGLFGWLDPLPAPPGPADTIDMPLKIAAVDELR